MGHRLRLAALRVPLVPDEMRRGEVTGKTPGHGAGEVQRSSTEHLLLQLHMNVSGV